MKGSVRDQCHQSPLSKDRIESMLLQFLAAGEKERVQNLDMSTLDSSEPWEIQALCEAYPTYLASLMAPSVISNCTCCFAPPHNVYCSHVAPHYVARVLVFTHSAVEYNLRWHGQAQEEVILG